jgi:hypothetical protein
MMPYIQAKTPTLAVDCQVCHYDCLYLQQVPGAFVDCPRCGTRHVPGPDSLADGERHLRGESQRGGPGVYVLVIDELPVRSLSRAFCDLITLRGDEPELAPDTAVIHRDASRCHRCLAIEALVFCTYCHQPVCPRCRAGTGAVSEGYTCVLGCTLADFREKVGEPPPAFAPSRGFWPTMRRLWPATRST